MSAQKTLHNAVLLEYPKYSY